MSRKPQHVSHAVNPAGEVDHNAVADELIHVAQLLKDGKLKLRNPSEESLGDGWDKISFERKFG